MKTNQSENPLYKADTVNLLIVDDEKSIRYLLSRILENEDYSCFMAANADEASIFLSTSQVDLAIIDINMPGRSGIQLLEEIQADYPAIGTIIITGSRDQKIVESAISMGVHVYLLKPSEYWLFCFFRSVHPKAVGLLSKGQQHR